MTVEFFDQEHKMNPLNGTKVYDRAELLRILEGLQSRPPFFCELMAVRGYSLLIGLAGSIGCAQYSPTDGSTPYLMATLTNG